MVVNKRRPNPAVLAAIENTLYRTAFKGCAINATVAFFVAMFAILFGSNLPNVIYIALTLLAGFIGLMAFYDLLKGLYHYMLMRRHLNRK